MTTNEDVKKALATILSYGKEQVALGADKAKAKVDKVKKSIVSTRQPDDVMELDRFYEEHIHDCAFALGRIENNDSSLSFEELLKTAKSIKISDEFNFPLINNNWEFDRAKTVDAQLLIIDNDTYGYRNRYAFILVSGQDSAMMHVLRVTKAVVDKFVKQGELDFTTYDVFENEEGTQLVETLLGTLQDDNFSADVNSEMVLKTVMDNEATDAMADHKEDAKSDDDDEESLNDLNDLINTIFGNFKK